MTDLLNTGKTALFAFQRALSTTSNNIANVNTDGYARQRVDFESLSTNGGKLNTGSGVRITNIERLVDEFATARVSSATSAHAAQQTHYEMASRLDELVATEGMSVAPALNNFFNAIQDANADPSSIAPRGVVIEYAEQLANRFQSLQGQFDDARDEVNDRTREAVNTVDQLAQSIADINARISTTGDALTSPSLHDLKDQRDQIVEKLSEYIDVDTLIQDNGAMSVFIGKGITLVSDSHAQKLSTTRDNLYPDRVQIQIGEGNSTQVLTSRLQGGIIGGLNEFSDDTLSDAMHELGRLALTFADEINQQHGVGVDLDGTPGADMFGQTEPEVFADTRNSGTGVVEGVIFDTQALEASDYVLRFDGASFTSTRSVDGVTTTGTMPLSLDGMTLSLSGTPVAGDTFVVSATGRAAGSMESMLDNPEELALAGQLATSSDIGNLGDSRIGPATITDPDNTALSDPIDIVFTSETTYDIVDGTSGAVLVGGETYEEDSPISYNGWEVAITGDAMDGDTHRIEPNLTGRGNNSNGLALAEMQTGLYVNGTESFSDAYGSLVSLIGSDTSTAATRTTALEALRDNAKNQQLSAQGVSLDEEAIDLTRYQQAYQASAQIISTSEEMFQTILGALR